jgi:hypothetical protein
MLDAGNMEAVQKRAHPVNSGFLNDINLCSEDLL